MLRAKLHHPPPTRGGQALSPPVKGGEGKIVASRHACPEFIEGLLPPQAGKRNDELAAISHLFFVFCFLKSG